MRNGWSTRDHALVLVPDSNPSASPREELRLVRIVVSAGERVSLALEKPPDENGERSGAVLWMYDDDPRVIACQLG